jgi:saccharopine dehydrogenase-like NADP-dependent oxidoreductase
MSKNILVLGAGRSSGTLINYLIEKAPFNGWKVVVADLEEEVALSKTKNRPGSEVVVLEGSIEQRNALIMDSFLVVSMLPPSFHLEIAKVCLTANAHLLTASYLSDEMKALHGAFEAKQLLMLGEMGLDPGIDHMSAMMKIREIQSKGGELLSFKSYTGGLVDQSSDNNPWHYKITWNPMNVVTAGQTTAQYIEGGKKAFVPYNRIFKNIDKVDVLGLGYFEGYANRDSLDYLALYGLQGIPTLKRGTLRYLGFCQAWDALVQLGLTENTTKIDFSDLAYYSDLTDSLLPHDPNALRQKVKDFLNAEESVMDKLAWLGLFDKQELKRTRGTLAEVLLDLIVEKLKIDPMDKDLVIMQHEFEYSLENLKRKSVATLVQRGRNSEETAMSRLVGLPLAIMTHLLYTGIYKGCGVKIPTEKEIYEPVMAELAGLGITFREWDVAMHR